MNKQKLVLIGGGHTHALTLHEFLTNGKPDADLTLVDPAAAAAYSGMLPGFVAGHYSRQQLDIDLRFLAQQVGADFIEARATGIDIARSVVELSNGNQIPFDYASVDVGITSMISNVTGFDDYGIPAKPLGRFAKQWTEFLSEPQQANVVIIGGGVAGAELSMAMAHALHASNRPASITVLDRGRMLSNLTVRTRQRVLRAMQRWEIRIMENVSPVSIFEDGVALDTGETLSANFVVAAAGATPYSWLEETDLDLKDGFLSVNAQLQTSDVRVFAVGDCAHFEDRGLPKAGVYAVRQAATLSQNLKRAIAGAELQAYKPQHDYLKLISLGSKQAIAEKYGFVVSGGWVWHLKNRIDGQFMGKFATPTDDAGIT